MTPTPPMNATEIMSWTSLPVPADTTLKVTTAAAPAQMDSVVIAVVIILVLLTVAGLSFFLYRYFCHNKGDYRTTGEPAPGEGPEDDDDDNSDQGKTEKKEYFI